MDDPRGVRESYLVQMQNTLVEPEVWSRRDLMIDHLGSRIMDAMAAGDLGLMHRLITIQDSVKEDADGDFEVIHPS